MFRFKPKDAPITAPSTSSGPVQHWPVFTSHYTATTAEIPDVNVTVTHQSPGILTIHVGLALSPVGWTIEDATPYGVSTGHETAEGARVVSLNLELRQLNLDEYSLKREKRKKISVIETSFGQQETDPTAPTGPARNAPEYITMHLHSQTAAKAGYREGRHWIDTEGRFNLTLISKDLMPNKPRHTQSVRVRVEQQEGYDLPEDARRTDEEAKYGP